MQYSAAHNVCVYETPIPERIVQCVPGARQVRPDMVSVPVDIQAMSAMRELGYQAMSPILADYDWPRNIRKVPAPFDHQRHVAAFLTLHPRAFNLCDIGTGKTLATLWAADYLMRLGIIRRALVLSPLSTLERVWQDEIVNHFLGRRSSNVLHGDRKKRLQLLGDLHDFYIINHDGLGVGSSRTTRGFSIGELARIVKARDDIDLIIVDEGSVYRDSQNLRYKVMREVADAFDYVWWLTGTPTPNEPTDAWAQARIVRRGYTEAFRTFRDRTMLKVSTFKYVPRFNSAQIVADTLQPAIRYHRDECLDLPDLMVETRAVELSKEQKTIWEELKKKLTIALNEGWVNAINEAALRMKLLQVSLGAIYGDQHEVHKVDAANRLSVLKEVIEHTNGKLLIFAPLTSVINLLYLELSKHYSVARIAGDVTAKQRSEIFKAFQQEPEPRIILADPRTMAHGLTLTAAATIVWYGPTDQPEIYQQANGRINRPGQTKSMLIVRLVATALEREIYRRLDSKEGMQGLILDIIKGIV